MGVKDLLRQAKKEVRWYKEYKAQLQGQEGDQVRFYNLWREPFKETWFFRFLSARHLLDSSKKTIAFSSVFGPRAVIRYDRSDIHCFFTAENIHHYYPEYSDLCQAEKKVGLSMGFDFFEDERYLRLPTWALRFFSPEADYAGIKQRCAELSRPAIGERDKFMSLVASWDPTGIRKDIYDALKGIAPIDCPGKWNHNDNSLRDAFGDDKRAYLAHYRYDVCSENSNAYGYVTEKLFDAVEAGCVPIYWGSYNRPEQDILNQEAILFWDYPGDNSATVRMIDEMERNPRLFADFASQPRLLPDAAEHVWEMYVKLEDRLRELIAQ